MMRTVSYALWMVVFVVAGIVLGGRAAAESASEKLWPSAFETGNFHWVVGPPIVAARESTPEMTYFSIKDPSVIRFKDCWHLFCTVRGKPRTHQVEYLVLRDWQDEQPRREFLRITDGYYCAPQVFYFRPHKKWYLIYQTSDPNRKPALQPAFSTNERLDDVAGWSSPCFLFPTGPEGCPAVD